MTTVRQNLFEFIAPESKPLVMENIEGKGLVLRGLFIQGDVKNHNGRVYPREEIERAVASINEKINKVGPVIGELDHPDGLGINMRNASHVITKMWMEGSNGFGEMRVMNEGEGRKVYGLVSIGAQLGVSSRGSGTVGGDGRVSDFDIVTIDIVANPSAPDALPRAIRESLELARAGQYSATVAEAIRKNRVAQRHVVKEFEQMLASVRDEIVFGRKV